MILVTESGQTNLQAYTNTVAGKSVKAEATVQVDLLGVPVPRGTVGDPRFVKITDGTNSPAIKNVAPLTTDYGLVTRSLLYDAVGNALNTYTSQPGTSQRLLGVRLPADPIISTIQAADPGNILRAVAADSIVGSSPSRWALDVFLYGSNSVVLNQNVSNTLVVDATSSGNVPVTQNLLGATDRPDISVNQTAVIREAQAINGLLKTLTPTANHLTTNATTGIATGDAWISSVIITVDAAGTTSTITIQDRSATPKKLVNAAVTTAISTTPTVLSLPQPALMSGGIDIVTAGAVAATSDVWVDYWQ